MKAYIKQAIFKSNLYLVVNTFLAGSEKETGTRSTGSAVVFTNTRLKQLYVFIVRFKISANWAYLINLRRQNKKSYVYFQQEIRSHLNNIHVPVDTQVGTLKTHLNNVHVPVDTQVRTLETLFNVNKV